MAEQIDLTQPYGTQTQVWRVQRVTLERTLDAEMSYIEVVLHGANGHVFTHAWRGQTADTMLVALNKADLSVKSLHRRIMEKLIADGVIEGSISGAAE